jgi:hypothetical protein
LAVTNGYWNGIPVRWAKRLFLGEVPCPTLGAAARGVRKLEGDRLEVRSGGDRYEYAWTEVEGKFTVEKLIWESANASGGVGARVEFVFRAPEDKSRVAMQWEAQSSAGAVKVRWKEREAVR